MRVSFRRQMAYPTMSKTTLNCLDALHLESRP